MKYRAEIDGLRAVAVIAVVLYHADVAGFGGGFVGVDVFFVISGFLITSLIVTDLDGDGFSFLGFWERRARRILPAIVPVIVFTLVVGLLVMVPEDYETLSRSALAQAVFSSNIFFWREAGYFAPTADELPLLHTWSLAVEEQFYLLFPITMVLITRYASMVRWAAVAGAAAVSLLISVWAVDGHETAGFYLLPARAWELGAGALLALWAVRNEPGPPAWLAELASVVGLAMIGAAVFGFSDQTPFPGYAAALPVAGTALLIWANTRSRTRTAEVLSLRPIVFVGLISYSLYLWHYPLLVFASYPSSFEVTPALTALIIGASFVLAYGSWRYVERPFRERRFLATRTAMLGGAASALVVVGALGLVAGSGGRSVAAQLNPEAIALAESYSGGVERQRTCEVFRPVRDVSALCTYGAEGGSPQFMLWGDSHARVLLPAMDALADEFGVTGVHVDIASCPPLEGWEQPNRFNDCHAINASVREAVEESDIRVVVLAAAWVGYLGGANETSEGAGGGSGSIVPELLLEQVRSLIADGVQVWVVRDSPRFAFDPPRRAYTNALLRRDLQSVGQSYADYLIAIEPIDRVLVVLEAEGVQVIDLPDVLCDAEFCPVVHDGVMLYSDNNHLSVQGAHFVEPALRPLFASLLDE